MTIKMTEGVQGRERNRGRGETVSEPWILRLTPEHTTSPFWVYKKRKVDYQDPEVPFRLKILFLKFCICIYTAPPEAKSISSTKKIQQTPLRELRSHVCVPNKHMHMRAHVSTHRGAGAMLKGAPVSGESS